MLEVKKQTKTKQKTKQKNPPYTYIIPTTEQMEAGKKCSNRSVLYNVREYPEFKATFSSSKQFHSSAIQLLTPGISKKALMI